jgi:hypothetical protein
MEVLSSRRVEVGRCYEGAELLKVVEFLMDAGSAKQLVYPMFTASTT